MATSPEQRATGQHSDLPHRITLQRPVTTQNSLGEEVPAWETVATVWARVDAISTREWVAASQTQTSITHRIRLRHRTVLPTWRVIYRGQPLEIVGDPVATDPTQTWLRIVAASQIGAASHTPSA